MQNRHYLETALFTGIATQDTKNALQLAQMIHNDQTAQLNATNTTGQTFFHQAITFHMPEVIQTILSLDPQQHALFFMENNEHEHCFHLALKIDNKDVIQQMFKIAAEPTSPYTEFWLKPDINGSLLLHHACAHNHETAVANLLEKIWKKPKTALSYINWTNHVGHIPLHQCQLSSAQIDSWPIIKMLILNGANCFFKDYKDNNSLSIAERLSLSELIEVAFLMHPNQQKNFIESYQKLSTSHSSAEIKNNYKNLLTAIKDQEKCLLLLQSKHGRFNNDLDTAYPSTNANESDHDDDKGKGKEKESTTSTSSSSTEEPDGLVPHTTSSESSDHDELSSAINHEIITCRQTDIETLQQLIQRLNRYLQSLNAIDSNNAPQKCQLISAIVIMALVYSFIETALTLSSKKEGNSRDNPYNEASIMFALLGGTVMFLSMVATCVFSSKIIPMMKWVRPHEWKALIQTLNETVIDQLKYLKELDNGVHLSINSNTLDKVEYDINQLTPEDRPFKDSIELFTQLKTDLETLRNEMYSTNQTSFSFYYKQRPKPVQEEMVIELSSSSSSAEETEDETPLQKFQQLFKEPDEEIPLDTRRSINYYNSFS